jgi:hypothetical protein
MSTKKSDHFQLADAKATCAKKSATLIKLENLEEATFIAHSTYEQASSVIVLLH